MKAEAKETKTNGSKLLVLGMGNTLVSDDGVGIHVAREVNRRLACSDTAVDVVEASGAGPELLSLLDGYEEAIMIDAVATRGGCPGTVYVFELESLSSTLHMTSPHSMNVYTAVELGRRCGLSMPRRTRIVAVEIEDNTNVAEALTPLVSEAVAPATDAVCAMIDGVIERE